MATWHHCEYHLKFLMHNVQNIACMHDKSDSQNIIYYVPSWTAILLLQIIPTDPIVPYN